MTVLDTLGRHYANITPLGQGAMGTVWRGTDRVLEREVAIKVMRPEMAQQDGLPERFMLEARALARLSHPNIVAVHRVFQEDELFWIEMEYVAGTPLDLKLRQDGALPWPTAVGLVIQALRGLEVAHAAGIVHRDIKPGNAIVTPQGDLKLMDFGIARVQQASALTRTGYALGTVAYMAPEQITTPHLVDERTDLYAIGILLYELLSGQAPFKGSTEYDILEQQVRATPPPLAVSGEQPPQALMGALMKALSKDPALRHASAQILRTALEAAVAAPSSGQSVPQAAWRLPSGWRQWAGVGVVALTLPFMVTTWLTSEKSVQKGVDTKPMDVPPAQVSSVALPVTTPPSAGPGGGDLGLGPSTRLPDLPASPARPVSKPPARSTPSVTSPPRVARAVTDPCSAFKSAVLKHEGDGELGRAIQVTGRALDEGCDRSYFLSRRQALVSRLRP